MTTRGKDPEMQEFEDYYDENEASDHALLEGDELKADNALIISTPEEGQSRTDARMSAIARAIAGKNRPGSKSGAPEGAKDSAFDPRQEGGKRKHLNTQDLRTFAQDQNIEIASDLALKNCGVLYRDKSKQEIISFAPPTDDPAGYSPGEELSFAPPMVQDNNICAWAAPAGHEPDKQNPDKILVPPANWAATSAASMPMPPLPPPRTESTAALVQSSDSNDDQPVSSINSTDVEDFQTQSHSTGEAVAHPYFTGLPARETYTAELRFRAEFNAAQEVAPLPVNQPGASSQEENWNAIEDFAPPAAEESAFIGHSSLNVLDIIDERYQTVPHSLPPQNNVAPRRPEVEVQYTQNQSKLSSKPAGLAGDFNVGSKRGQPRGKNRWSKKN